MKNLKHPDYKNDKILNNTQRSRILKAKNIGLKNKELQDREPKIKNGELFFKQIIVSIDDMDRFEQREINKKKPIKGTWYDWTINYVSDPIWKPVGGFKNKIGSLLRQAHLGITANKLWAWREIKHIKNKKIIQRK